MKKNTENYLDLPIGYGENITLRNEYGYGIWGSMIQRCSNPNDTNYSKYGGRGITVCERWKKSFVTFYKDMGKRPSLLHSLDRIDNNKGYSPENCRWTSKTVQSINRNKQKNNKSGITGISWDKSRDKWTVHIQINHKQINIGRFTNLAEAKEVRTKAELLYHKPILDDAMRKL